MENYWSMFKDWALWLASPTLGVSLFMSPSLLLSFLQLLVKTAHGNDATSPHSKAMKSSPLLGLFCCSEFWGFSLLKI